MLLHASSLGFEGPVSMIQGLSQLLCALSCCKCRGFLPLDFCVSKWIWNLFRALNRDHHHDCSASAYLHRKLQLVDFEMTETCNKVPHISQALLRKRSCDHAELRWLPHFTRSESAASQGDSSKQGGGCNQAYCSKSDFWASNCCRNFSKFLKK